MREYTALPYEYLEEMARLSDAEYGRLIRALQTYSITGQEPDLKGAEVNHWIRVRNRENRYQASFEEQDKAKTDRATRAAQARWANAKNANACVSTSSNAKNAKTETKTNTKTKTKNIPPKSPQGDAFGVLAGDDKALLDALTAFAAMRKQIKAPMTDRAKSMMAKRLTELSGGNHAAMIAILDQSTVHCWKDVYALKGQQGASAKPSGLPDGKFTSGDAERASVSALARYREQLREG